MLTFLFALAATWTMFWCVMYLIDRGDSTSFTDSKALCPTCANTLKAGSTAVKSTVGSGGASNHSSAASTTLYSAPSAANSASAASSASAPRAESAPDTANSAGAPTSAGASRATNNAENNPGNGSASNTANQSETSNTANQSEKRAANSSAYNPEISAVRSDTDAERVSTSVSIAAKPANTAKLASITSASPESDSIVKKPVADKHDQANVTPLFKTTDEADDLKTIKGIGVVMERTLNDLGITTFKQLAGFQQADVKMVSDVLSESKAGFGDRIERDEWVDQAKGLVKKAS